MDARYDGLTHDAYVYVIAEVTRGRHTAVGSTAARSCMESLTNYTAILYSTLS